MGQDLYINTKNELIKIKNDYEKEIAKYQYRILICSGGGCVSSNCHEVKNALIEALNETNLQNKVQVIETGCIGTCDLGPVMLVMPEGVFYTELEPDHIKSIVSSHLVNGNIEISKTYFDKKTEKNITNIKDIPYFQNQIKIALKNCGNIDFSSIEEYIAHDGYIAIANVLDQLSPAGVVEEVKKSGLRGRGGGGFPAGIKWEAGMKADGKEKFIVCNADEGDPGAFMDRSILEGDPHSIIEGMMAAGYAIGANKGYVYVRAEYPLAIERLDVAIRQARKVGLLGNNILQSGFGFDIEIRIGAGAFVCGEETALMASIEGERGEPKQKPPFPFQKGLFGKPTIINNVETFANIPSILIKGSEWFSQYGTEKSKGTKVFALAGDINNTGIVEVPMGTTLGDILFGIGGGIPRNKAFKAAQTGGPSGGCITQEFLNVPMDYDSLVKLGAIMGSGGLICMDENTCMVDMAKFFMEFVQDESCGKCVPCRLGTKRMLEILEKITQGKGESGDIELLEELGAMIKETAICGLGQTAPNPVLSTINYFREEYEQHIKDKYCIAGACSDLFISPCQNACPAGINVPGYIALIADGRVKDAYNLIMQENPFPAVCGRVCTHPCEAKCRRGQIDESISIADLKRYAADYVYKNEETFTHMVVPKNDKKVAVIGAGPSGLTCAYYLAKLGYDVSVFESQPVAGGVLVFGIPEYRLPKDVLASEIKVIEQLGVKINLNTEVGKDISFIQLQKDYDAIYIATGTQYSHKVNIPGEELEGVYYGLDFLKDINLDKEVKLGDKIAVIGGGNTAIDAARTAIRLGAKEVSVLYRRTLEDMPADPREIRDAIEEGVNIITLVAPVSLEGNETVNKIKCKKMELADFDSSGRRKPKDVEGSEFYLDVDTAIIAVSQYSDLPFINKDEVETTKWGTFVTDKETMMTSIYSVFAGGDVTRGPDTVIVAIADGKNVAISIDKFLGGKGILNRGANIEIPKAAEEKEIVEHEKFPMKYIEPKNRVDNFDEVAIGFHKLNAIAEAMRCLRCDRRA